MVDTRTLQCQLSLQREAFKEKIKNESPAQDDTTDNDAPLIFEPDTETKSMTGMRGSCTILQLVSATIFAMLVIILPAFICFVFVYVSWMRVPLAIYFVFCYMDPAVEDGIGRRALWIHRLPIWRYIKAYFPSRIVLEKRLDPHKSYVFGVSPHGILSYAGQVMIGSQMDSLNAALEGLKLHPVALRPALLLPLFREYLLGIGTISASRKCIQRCLTRNGGNSVVIVIGGAKESLYTNRGNRKLVLRNRKGFVREAIIAGALLVPIFVFGENDIFSQASFDLLYKIQTWLQRRMKFALPIFYGRFGFIPHRTPITYVFGKPISLEKNANPTQQEIDHIHDMYISELFRIYSKFRPLYDPLGDETLDLV